MKPEPKTHQIDCEMTTAVCLGRTSRDFSEMKMEVVNICVSLGSDLQLDSIDLKPTLGVEVGSGEELWVWVGVPADTRSFMWSVNSSRSRGVGFTSRVSWAVTGTEVLIFGLLKISVLLNGTIMSSLM